MGCFKNIFIYRNEKVHDEIYNFYVKRSQFRVNNAIQFEYIFS